MTRHRDVVIGKLESMAMSIMLQLVRCTAKLAPETSDCEEVGEDGGASQSQEEEEEDMDGDDENTQTQGLGNGEGSFSGSQKKGKKAAVRTGRRVRKAKAKPPGVSIKLVNRNRNAYACHLPNAMVKLSFRCYADSAPLLPSPVQTLLK
jgi:hypothetical protein